MRWFGPLPSYNGLQSELCVERVQMQWEEGLHIFSRGLGVNALENSNKKPLVVIRKIRKIPVLQ